MSQLHLQEYIFIRELISSNFAMHMYENDYTHTDDREREREHKTTVQTCPGFKTFIPNIHPCGLCLKA